MCDKAVDNYSTALEFVPDRYNSKKMCDNIISENPFMLKYCPDKYITQKICDEAVDDFLSTLNFIPDWFVKSKVIKTLFTALYADENILYFDEDFGNVVCNCDEIGILNEDDHGTIIHVRFLGWHFKFAKRKEL